MKFTIIAHCTAKVQITDIPASSPEEAMEIFKKQWRDFDDHTAELTFADRRETLDSCDIHRPRSYLEITHITAE